LRAGPIHPTTSTRMRKALSLSGSEDDEPEGLVPLLMGKLHAGGTPSRFFIVPAACSRHLFRLSRKGGGKK